MDLMERANDRRRMYMRDRIEHKLDDALRDNARLEQTNELLKQELERDDRERDQIWSAVKTGMRGRSRRSGWFRRTLLFAGSVGAAYVFGAKAGRGRYEEMLTWWDRMRGRASMMQDDMQRTVTNKASDVTDQLAGKIQEGASKTGDKIEEGGYKAAESVRSTSPSSSGSSASGSSTPGSSGSTPSSTSSRSSGSSSSSTPKG